MIVNKKRHLRILFFPFLAASFLNGFVFSAHGMMHNNNTATAIVPAQQNFTGVLRLLNSFSRNGLEIVSQGVQDEVYGLPEYFSNDNPLVKIVQEAYRELKQELKLLNDISLSIKKMNKHAVCKVAKEFQFMGIHPTNGSLYLDEEFLSSKKPEAQKLLIKMALKHYLNNTYVKVQSARFLAATMCGYLAYHTSRFGYQQIAKMTKSFIQTDSTQTEDLPWYSPIQLAIGAAKHIIMGLIMTKTYSVAQYLLDKPVTKYLIESAHEKIEHEFSDKEQSILKINRQKCKELNFLLSDPAQFEQKIMQEIMRRKQQPNFNPVSMAFEFGKLIHLVESCNPSLANHFEKLIHVQLTEFHNQACELSE